MNSRTRYLFCALSVMGLLHTISFANRGVAQVTATTWVGNSSTDLGDAANWSPALPTTNNSATSNIEFGAPGTSGTVLDMGTGTSAYRNWIFDAGAPSYSFNGPGGTIFFNFRSGATTTVNNSTSSQSFTAPAFLIQRGNLNAAAGDFQLNGPLAVERNDNAAGSLQGAFNIYLNQGFLGEGSTNNFQITKINTGTLFVNNSVDSGAGLWAGQLAISNGTVQINGNDSLGAVGDPVAGTGWTEVRSAWQITNASDTAQLALNGVSTGETIFLAGRGSATSAATAHIVSLNGSGPNTLSGVMPAEVTPTDSTIALQAGGTSPGDKLTISGDMPQIFSSVTATLSLQGAGTGEISGTISQPSNTAIFGLGALTDNVWNVVKNDAGTWTISGPQAYTGTTTVAGGTLLINAAHTGGAAYSVLSGGTLGGNGTINTAGNAGVSVAAGGFLAPGAPTGTLHMDLGSGTLDISGAVAATASHSLLFTLGTTSTSSEVQLTNAATALTIGTGVLNFDDFLFTNIAGFGAGTYTLFDSSTAILGTLGSSLTGTIGGLSATLSLADSNHDIVLTVSSGTLLGDVNGDHVVNGLDIAVVASHWLLTGATLGQGDANGDGTVNGLDIALIASHWLNTSPGPGAGSGEGSLGTAAVPEPASYVLAALGLIGLAMVRRRHSRLTKEA